MGNRIDKLLDAAQSYSNRLGRKLYIESEVVPLVMNLAYLEVLKANKNGEYSDAIESYRGYESAAIYLFPGFSDHFDDSILFGYTMTLKWDGLWDFLREFFESKLGVSIDEVKLDLVQFNSSNHTRYENEVKIINSIASRLVKLQFSENKNRLKVSISEVLSDKIAIFQTSDANKKVYIGTDPDYKFIIEFDKFDNVEEFTLHMIPKKLKIIYHE